MRQLIYLIALVLFASALGGEITYLLKTELGLRNGKSDILIQLNKQVDFDKLTDAKGVHVDDMEDHDARGFLVMNTLMEHAKTHQASLKSFLKSKNVEFTSYWVSNTICVKQATEELINELAKREDIKLIEANKAFSLDLGTPNQENVKSVEEPEWNVKWIKADQVWKKGYEGKGIVVGVSDSGVQHDHPALLKSYRGYKDGKVEHDYNWYDATPNKVPVPEDDNGHGIHCTGTVAGGNDGKKIGMAPKAKWIHCRSMKIRTRQWSPESFIGCLQFFLAPTDVKGNNPNPKLRPHTTSHSYGCSAGLGCPDQDAMRPASEALRSAGVYMFVSAGNSGSRCSSVNTQPGFYEKVVTVGASGRNSNTIASFSSRGPVTVDGSNRLKPEITAPGVQVVSCGLGGTYRSLSGTSMASPAVNGAVALLWEAVPKLQRRMKKTMALVYKTATPMESTQCGSTQNVPNNVYGYGIINIEKAVEEGLKLYQ